MRSKLFVPGSRPALFEKAVASAADALSFDLEDAVAADRKAAARAAIAGFLRAGALGGKAIIVRVNALDTDLFALDVQAMVGPGLDVINVPKVESGEDIRRAVAVIAQAEQAAGVTRPIGILANIETPKSLRLAYEIAAADPRVLGLQLGFGDLLLPYGISRTDEAAGSYARAAVKFAAAVAGIACYDGAYFDVTRRRRLPRRGTGRAQPRLCRQKLHPPVADRRRERGVHAGTGGGRARLARARRSARGGGGRRRRVRRRRAADRRADPDLGAPGRRGGGAGRHDRRGGARAVTAGPLHGTRVLDLSAYIAGPYGCTLLADTGAEVIKIEPPAGDNLRKYPSTLAAEGRAFLGVNRGKRGVVLDLKRPEGLAVLKRLVATADVLVHNFRPDVPARLGIDYPSLRAENPRLIYCAMTGYGEGGPLKDKAGYDQVLQTMTGICALQGKPAAPQIVFGSVVDYYGAAMLAFGVTAALLARARTGEGQFVGVSLMRSALAMQSARMVWAESEGRDIGRDMRSGGITGLHPTQDGFLYISANTPHFWRALCAKIGRAELAEDPRFDTVRKRAEHAEELLTALRTALAAHTALEWEQIFGEEVPCAAARTVEDMFDHPQVLAEGMIETFEHPLVGRYRGFARPVAFGTTPGDTPRAAPTFGQHSGEVLAELGYDDGEVEQLRSLGAIS